MAALHAVTITDVDRDELFALAIRADRYAYATCTCGWSSWHGYRTARGGTAEAAAAVVRSRADAHLGAQRAGTVAR